VGQTLKALEADDESIAAKQEIVQQYNRVISMRKQILRNQEAGKIIEMANQAGIYAFAQGVKRIKPGDNGMDNEFLKRSCYHYHTLYVSTRDAITRLLPLLVAARDAVRVRDKSEKSVSVS
jgi:hypothetical protein